MKLKVGDIVEVCNAYVAGEKLNGMTGQAIAFSMFGSVFVKLDNDKHMWFLPKELRPVAKTDVSKDIPRKVRLADVLEHK